MKKILVMLLIIMINIPLLAQENEKPKRDLTDKSDEGWYFSNHFMGR